MSLSSNPIARLVSSISQNIQQVTNDGQAAVRSAASEIKKLEVDQKISDLSGEIGSAFNGATSAIKNGVSDFGQQASKFNTAFDDIAGLASQAGSTSLLKADISGISNKLNGGSLASGLKNFAGSISKTAGSINDILSLKRSSNLPSGAEIVKEQTSAIQLNPGLKDDWRVRIVGPWDIFNSEMFNLLKETGGVVWPYLPNITLSTKANYTNVDLIHSNYPYYAYKNSTVDEIQISGEFSCETEYDAAYWIAATTFFKTATKMFFGQSEGDTAGNPPIICQLIGYGSNVFDRIPVVVTSFSIELKDDVNYIKCTKWPPNASWVPVLSNITVGVTPIYSRERLRKFNLQSYASGKMVSDGVGYL
jgi:hypothetical protein